jgi:hypothetical protein
MFTNSRTFLLFLWGSRNVFIALVAPLVGECG